MEGISLVAALGNPGARYTDSRHNAGWWCLDALQRDFGLIFRHESKFSSEVARASLDGRSVWFIAPQTFMNLSGDAVAAFARYYRIAPENILVVYDDLDLPPGTVRLKSGGGLGGHKGLTDIERKLGSRDFVRVRIGIGHPGTRDDVIGYVLHAPRKAERELIDAAIDRIWGQFRQILGGEYERVMNELHRSEPAARPAGQ